MAFASINDIDIIEANIKMPRKGVWHAWLVVDTADAITGNVTIKFGDPTNPVVLIGTVARGGPQIELNALRVVAGAGGMDKVIPPKGFKSTVLESPLRDALQAAGERLSDDSDRKLLDAPAPLWGRHRGTCARAVQNVLDQIDGCTWRHLADGTVYAGRERWPNTKLGEYQELGRDPMLNIVVISADHPNIFPGERLGSDLVSSVEHSFKADSLRTKLFLENV
jgi:hypothetical protein